MASFVPVGVDRRVCWVSFVPKGTHQPACRASIVPDSARKGPLGKCCQAKVVGLIAARYCRIGPGGGAPQSQPRPRPLALAGEGEVHEEQVKRDDDGRDEEAGDAQGTIVRVVAHDVAVGGQAHERDDREGDAE